MTESTGGGSGQDPSARLDDMLRRRRQADNAETQSRHVNEASAAQALGQAGQARGEAPSQDPAASPPDPLGLTPPEPTDVPSSVPTEAGPTRVSVQGAGVTASAAPGEVPAKEAASEAGVTASAAETPTPGSAADAVPDLVRPADDLAAEPVPPPPAPWRAVPATTPAQPEEEEKKKRKRRPFAFLLGLLGELLITLGLLIGLYVAWELVWTTWETNREVRAQVTELRQDPVWAVPQGDGYAPERQGDPGAQCGIVTPEEEGLWGLMHVPRWGAEYQVPVVEGTDRVRILNKGLIGHYPDTQPPGAVGNFATSAHRTTYGQPYSRVQELQTGDLAIFESSGCYLVYKMTGTEVVYPWEYRVVWPVPNEENAEPTKRIMTFTTCHPPFSAAQRFVVWFEMQYWADKADGPLRVLSEPVEGG